MTSQLRMADIFSNFILNKECVLDFLENLKIPDLDLSKFNNLMCENFCNNINVCLYNRRNRNDVQGFIIKGDGVEVYILNPDYDYLKFWNARNFLTYNLARFYKNDTTIRYMVNISCKDFLNSLSKFNEFSNFYIWNIYRRDEKLENWINVLYY